MTTKKKHFSITVNVLNMLNIYIVIFMPNLVHLGHMSVELMRERCLVLDDLRRRNLDAVWR